MSLYRRKGSKVWWIDICHDKQRIKRSTGTADKKLADKIHTKVKAQLVEGKWFELDEERSRTLEDLAEKYLQERSTVKSPQSRERDKQILNHFLTFFGSCVLTDITPKRLNEYKNKRLGCVTGQTVKKELGVLKNAFNVAIKEWEWLKDNPVSRISMPKDPPGRLRFLRGDEIERLLDCSDSWFRPVLIVAIHTGLREGNIISLSWDRIDMFRRIILFDAKDLKNETSLGIPINDTLLNTLKELYKVKHLNSKLVFMRNGKPLYKLLLWRALRRACKKADLTDFRFHDLRHTFASLLVQSGIDLYSVQRLMGHKDGRMTQRYAHLSQEKLMGAIKALDDLRNIYGTVE